jgi:UDP-N-acetylglucosamine acyltransferase
MVGGMARVTQDIPPFVMIDGSTVMVVGLNKVGLRRGGIGIREMEQIKAAYRVIYRSGLAWAELLDVLQLEFPTGAASEFAPFFAEGKRGFVQERRTPPGATIRLMRDDSTESTNVGFEKKVG